MSVFQVPPKPPKRDQQVRIMMSRDEKRSMQRVAKLLGLTTSDVIRTAVNEFVKKTRKRR